MKALKCEMCGSTNLIKEGGVFVCQSCGTKYSVEEAKKMMVEGTVDVKGTVKVDTSDELKNLYEIARRAKDAENSDNAAKYYDMILVKDPGSWEANYYVVYFKSMGCKIGEIWSAASDMANCQSSVVQLIKDNETDETLQKAALTEISLRNTMISSMLFNAAKSHYEGIDASIQHNFIQDYCNNASASAQIMYNFGDEVDAKFEGKYSDISIPSWKSGIDIHKEYVKYLQDKDGNINIINSYGDKIRKYDSSYANPNVDTSACYVATAVYGSYDCPEVWTLRRFRDFTLDGTWYGRLFIKTYYATSPTFVKYFGNVKLFKSQGKKLLDKWVARLNTKGYESTPYKDKY
ncbi:MAG: TFIIB-type zinc finger domain-containing protein [Prevotella sp.]|nr:TFIIB-type zinc finger domain-containing protein [Prevotella sp.]